MVNNQIIRFNGKNTFCEVMSSAFPIGKVQINFIEYNAEAEKNSRITRNIKLYMDIPKALVLTQDILTGKMSALAKQALDAKDKGGYKYCKEIFSDLGGVNAKKLEERKTPRNDGKCLSRQFKVTPGEKIAWILSGEQGAGEENETGLIVPVGRPEETVRVALTDEDFKKFALMIQFHLQAFMTTQYTNPPVDNK